MSTFGGLNAAYTGLAAARAGIEVTGQNIVNATTVGYTRQRVMTSSVAAPAAMGPLDGIPRAGGGTLVDSIARLDNALLDSRVRTTSSSAGYWQMATSVNDSIETTLREPGTNGISASLQSLWASWQTLSNYPGQPAATSVVLEDAHAVAAKIAQGYNETDALWTDVRKQAVDLVNEINSTAQQIGSLNDQIRGVTAAGGNANELLDRRAQLTTTLASIAGAVTRDNADGSVDVSIGGTSIVTAASVQSLVVTGSFGMAGAAGSPVTVEWAAHPGVAAELEGGKLAAAVAALAPASASGGGVIANAAASYNTLATTLAATVNAIHSTGATPSGATGLDFFSFAVGVPAALGLQVVPTDASGIAAATPGAGTGDGSVADAIAQLGTSTTGADNVWSRFVVGTASDARMATQQSSLADLAAASASTMQQSQASVDLDEETTILLTYQHAYQGAARVMTAIDEMLDVLINRTGLVGR